MSDKRSIRFPDDLTSRIEGAALAREKFSATVVRLVEQGLGVDVTSDPVPPPRVGRVEEGGAMVPVGYDTLLRREFRGMDLKPGQKK